MSVSQHISQQYGTAKSSIREQAGVTQTCYNLPLLELAIQLHISVLTDGWS